ncbi:MAG: hypothetical protein AB8B87_20205 [Granulosicoccus sp.]
MNEILRTGTLCVSLALLMQVTACGGGGDNNDGGSDNGSGPTQPPVNPGPGPVQPPIVTDEIPALSVQSTITVASGRRILDASINPSGNQVAVLSVATSDPTFDFSQTYEIDVYDAATGGLALSMNDIPRDVSGPSGLYWGSDRISVVGFTGGYTVWNAQSGALLNTIANGASGNCLSLGVTEAFDAESNVLYVTAPFAEPFICQFDFNSLTTQEHSVELPSAGNRIESLALDTVNDSLWVSYNNDNNLAVSGTQIYDLAPFAPSGSLLSGNLGAIVGVGDGYQIYDTAIDLVVQPLASILDGGSVDVTASALANVVGQRDDGMLRLIALPEQTYIGEINLDDDNKRSFSTDGSVGAFTIDDSVQVYSLASRGTVSAIAPAQTFGSTLTGTLTIDGVSEPLNGTCNTDVDPDVGPNIVDIAATTQSGSRFSVRAQNLLGFISYNLQEGVQFTDSQVDSLHSTTLAQNFMLEQPVIATDGTSITGSTLLYQFSSDTLFDLVTDSEDPTGFATRSLMLDATCL